MATGSQVGTRKNLGLSPPFPLLLLRREKGGNGRLAERCRSFPSLSSLPTSQFTQVSATCAMPGLTQNIPTSGIRRLEASLDALANRYNERDVAAAEAAASRAAAAAAEASAQVDDLRGRLGRAERALAPFGGVEHAVTSLSMAQDIVAHAQSEARRRTVDAERAEGRLAASEEEVAHLRERVVALEEELMDADAAGRALAARLTATTTPSAPTPTTITHTSTWAGKQLDAATRRADIAERQVREKDARVVQLEAERSSLEIEVESRRKRETAAQAASEDALREVEALRKQAAAAAACSQSEEAAELAKQLEEMRADIAESKRAAADKDEQHQTEYKKRTKEVEDLRTLFDQAKLDTRRAKEDSAAERSELEQRVMAREKAAESAAKSGSKEAKELEARVVTAEAKAKEALEKVAHAEAKEAAARGEAAEMSVERNALAKAKVDAEAQRDEAKATADQAATGHAEVLGKFKERVKQLQGSCEEAKANAQKATAEKAALQEQMNELEARLRAADQAATDGDSETRERYEQRISDLKAELGHERERSERLEKVADKKSRGGEKEVGDLQGKLRLLEERIADLDAARSKAEAESDRYKSMANESSRKDNEDLKAMSVRLFQLETELAEATKSAERAQAVDSESERLRERIATLERELEENERNASAAVKQAEESSQGTAKALEALRAKHASLNEQLAAESSRVESLEEEKYGLIEEIEQARESASSSGSHEQNLREQLASAESRMKQIEEEKYGLAAELESWESRMKQVEEEKYGLAAELEAAEQAKKPPPPPPPRKPAMELDSSSMCIRGMFLAPKSKSGEGMPVPLCECNVRISGQGIQLEAADLKSSGAKTLSNRKDAFSLFELAQFAVNSESGTFIFEVPSDNGSTAYGIQVTPATSQAIQKVVMCFIEEKMEQMNGGKSPASRPPPPPPPREQPDYSSNVQSAAGAVLDSTSSAEDAESSAKKKFSLRRAIGMRGKSKHDESTS